MNAIYNRNVKGSLFTFHFSLFIFHFSLFILLVSCDVKDPIYDRTNPGGTGQITITADWSQIGSGITKPQGYTIAFGSKTYTATADTYKLPDLVDPGKYTIYSYNTADHITVSGTMATVAVSGSEINAMPGWFFTCKHDANVEKDTDYTFTVVMMQQIRQLTLVIEPTGGTADKISTMAGTLSGVAGSYDMADGTHGTASTVALSFTKITEGADAGKWTATVRLVGITGSTQRLAGTITFTDGVPGDIAFESELSTALTDFNANKPIPLELGGTIVETPTGAGFEATIIDWVTNSGGSAIAN